MTPGGRLRGRAVAWTDAEVAELAAVTPEDVARARAAFRTHGRQERGLAALLDATPLDAATGRPAGLDTSAAS